MYHPRTLLIYLGLLMGITLLWLNGAGGLWAQQPAAEEDAAAPAEAQQPIAAEANADVQPEESSTSIGSLVFRVPQSASDWFGIAFYIVLFVFSMVACTIAIERAVRLRREKILPGNFVRQLRDLMQGKEDTHENLKSLAESSDAPIAKVLRGGLYRAGRPLSDVEKGMEDALHREMAEIRSRHRPLAVIGSVAPLVGLLGTVVGIMFAFMASSERGFGDTAGAVALAKGIYLALLTTAAGLSIAIPCMLLVAWFNSRTERFFREMDEHLLTVTPSFSRMAAEDELAPCRTEIASSTNHDEGLRAVSAK